MKKQIRHLVPVVALAGLGLVTTGCSLLTPTTAPVVGSDTTAGGTTGGSGWLSGDSSGGWLSGDSSGGLFSGFGSGLFGGFFG